MQELGSAVVARFHDFRNELQHLGTLMLKNPIILSPDKLNLPPPLVHDNYH